jgi:D-proline reductase (dithiol) PrdB
VSALSYYLERQGLITTGVSLVRENTESMQPPRALWVSFPLGRPLGKPGDAEFQTQVIMAALELVNRSSGPVLEDYPCDLPDSDLETVAACPVSFAKAAVPEDSWQNRLLRELSSLESWYELSKRRREGRTLVGISDLTPRQNIQSLGKYLDQGQLPEDVHWLKRAVEDLKVYYIEAMTAQPGDYAPNQIQQIFWQQTELGEAILMFYQQFQQSDNVGLKLVARMLAPREAVGQVTGPERE